jgi:hypothetical protein
VQSNGSNLRDVWGGSVSKRIPFSFATLMTGTDKKSREPGVPYKAFHTRKNASNTHQTASDWNNLLSVHLQLKL